MRLEADEAEAEVMGAVYGRCCGWRGSAAIQLVAAALEDGGRYGGGGGVCAGGDAECPRRWRADGAVGRGCAKGADAWFAGGAD